MRKTQNGQRTDEQTNESVNTLLNLFDDVCLSCVCIVLCKCVLGWYVSEYLILE